MDKGEVNRRRRGKSKKRRSEIMKKNKGRREGKREGKTEIVASRQSERAVRKKYEYFTIQTLMVRAVQ